jgi:hypothetical protein
MVCIKGCCAKVLCCGTENDRPPAPPQAPASQPVDLQIALHAARVWAVLIFPPARESFISRDEEPGRHSPPTLATTCICLI